MSDFVRSLQQCQSSKKRQQPSHKEQERPNLMELSQVEDEWVSKFRPFHQKTFCSIKLDWTYLNTTLTSYNTINFCTLEISGRGSPTVYNDIVLKV